MTETIGHWLPILEYAHKKKKSISTVRRYIKANILKHKIEDGRYYIWTSEKNLGLTPEIKLLLEENNELKMLVKLYEEKLGINNVDTCPEYLGP